MCTYFRYVRDKYTDHVCLGAMYLSALSLKNISSMKHSEKHFFFIHEKYEKERVV